MPFLSFSNYVEPWSHISKAPKQWQGHTLLFSGADKARERDKWQEVADSWQGVRAPSLGCLIRYFGDDKYVVCGGKEDPAAVTSCQRDQHLESIHYMLERGCIGPNLVMQNCAGGGNSGTLLCRSHGDFSGVKVF